MSNPPPTRAEHLTPEQRQEQQRSRAERTQRRSTATSAAASTATSPMTTPKPLSIPTSPRTQTRITQMSSKIDVSSAECLAFDAEFTRKEVNDMIAKITKLKGHDNFKVWDASVQSMLGFVYSNWLNEDVTKSYGQKYPVGKYLLWLRLQLMTIS